jgi:plasmid stabilization system protein ParE
MAYIAADDPAAARRWLRRLLERVESLTGFPDSGRAVPEYAREDMREIVGGAYRVMYRRGKRSVEIAAVHHHARRAAE